MTSTGAPGTPRSRWRRALRAAAPFGAAALLVILPFVAIGELPGERWLSAGDAHAPIFAALGVLLLVLDVVLPVPSSVVGTLLGGRLGFGLGFACSWLGLTLGHVAGYWLGRLAPRRWVPDEPVSPGWLGVLVSRPVPVLAETLALAAGALRMPWRLFLSATLAGNAVYAAALAASGAALLSEDRFVAALLVPLLLMALAGWLWRRRATPRG